MANYTKKPRKNGKKSNASTIVEKVKSNGKRRRHKWGPSREKSLRRLQRIFAANKQGPKNKQHSRGG